jgi:hypothetical protein
MADAGVFDVDQNVVIPDRPAFELPGLQFPGGINCGIAF